MANNYITLIDEDKNGLLSINEFSEFIATFDGITMTENEVTKLFNLSDIDKDGFLSNREFADCLFEMIIPEGFVET